MGDGTETADVIDEPYQAKSAKNARNGNEVSLYFMSQVDQAGRKRAGRSRWKRRRAKTKGRARELKTRALRRGGDGSGTRLWLRVVLHPSVAANGPGSSASLALWNGE